MFSPHFAIISLPIYCVCVMFARTPRVFGKHRYAEQQVRERRTRIYTLNKKYMFIIILCIKKRADIII